MKSSPVALLLAISLAKVAVGVPMPQGGLFGAVWDPVDSLESAILSDPPAWPTSTSASPVAASSPSTPIATSPISLTATPIPTSGVVPQSSSTASSATPTQIPTPSTLSTSLGPPSLSLKARPPSNTVSEVATSTSTVPPVNAFAPEPSAAPADKVTLAMIFQPSSKYFALAVTVCIIGGFLIALAIIFVLKRIAHMDRFADRRVYTDGMPFEPEKFQPLKGPPLTEPKPMRRGRDSTLPVLAKNGYGSYSHSRESLQYEEERKWEREVAWRKAGFDRRY